MRSATPPPSAAPVASPPTATVSSRIPPCRPWPMPTVHRESRRRPPMASALAAAPLRCHRRRPGHPMSVSGVVPPFPLHERARTHPQHHTQRHRREHRVQQPFPIAHVTSKRAMSILSAIPPRRPKLRLLHAVNMTRTPRWWYSQAATPPSTPHRRHFPPQCLLPHLQRLPLRRLPDARTFAHPFRLSLPHLTRRWLRERAAHSRHAPATSSHTSLRRCPGIRKKHGRAGVRLFLCSRPTLPFARTATVQIPPAARP